MCSKENEMRKVILLAILTMASLSFASGDLHCVQFGLKSGEKLNPLILANIAVEVDFQHDIKEVRFIGSYETQRVSGGLIFHACPERLYGKDGSVQRLDRSYKSTFYSAQICSYQVKLSLYAPNSGLQAVVCTTAKEETATQDKSVIELGRNSTNKDESNLQSSEKAAAINKQ